MRTAPPTSPAPSRSASRPTKCATASPACCAATSRSRARSFPTAPPARSSTRLARQFLWQAGLDFEHGTGHGVGSYLSVHEGPARISKLGTTPLKRGMILSNEPGYYKTDAYGIRIENLELVDRHRRRRRRKAGQCVRDADAGADRPPPDRREHAEPDRAEMAERLPRARQPRGAPASRRQRHEAVAG